MGHKTFGKASVQELDMACSDLGGAVDCCLPAQAAPLETMMNSTVSVLTADA